MKEERRALRRQQIIKAAYAVLAERGYSGTSMLAVAERAKASNETLYNWFGSKQGLFQAMVRENARSAAEILDRHLVAGADLRDTLAKLGPALLRVVTDERAVALNRAAAADASDTGVLGQTIAESGRERVAPMLERVFARARDRRQLECTDPSEAAEFYISLLIGDLQIRRVIGVKAPPSETEISMRAERAREALEMRYRPSTGRNPPPAARDPI